MTQVVRIEYATFGVGENRKRQLQLLDHPGVLLDRIHHDRDDVGAVLLEVPFLQLQTLQLREAVRSPEATIEKQDDVAAAERGQPYGDPTLVLQLEVGGQCAHGRSASRWWQMIGRYEQVPTQKARQCDVEHRQDRCRDPSAAPALKGVDCTPHGQEQPCRNQPKVQERRTNQEAQVRIVYEDKEKVAHYSAKPEGEAADGRPVSR